MGILSPETRSAWMQFGYTLGEQMRARATQDGFKKYINEDYAEYKAKIGELTDRLNAVDPTKETDEMAHIHAEFKQTMEEFITQSAVNYPGNSKVADHTKMMWEIHMGKVNDLMGFRKQRADIARVEAETEQAKTGAESNTATAELRREEIGLIPARKELLKQQAGQAGSAAELNRARAQALGGENARDPLAKIPPEEIPSYIETSPDFQASRNRMEMALSLRKYKEARERSPNINPVTGQAWDPNMKTDLGYFTPDYKDVIRETVANETLIRAPLHPEWGLPSNPTREDIDVIFPVETFGSAEVGPRASPGLTGNYSPREVAETLVGRDVIGGLERDIGVPLKTESDLLKSFPKNFDDLISLNRNAAGELGPLVTDLARFAESHGRVPTEFADPSEMEGGLGPRIGTFGNLKELLTELFDNRINHTYGFKATESALPPPDESVDADTLRSRRRARSVAARLLFMYLAPLAEELDLEDTPLVVPSIFGPFVGGKDYYTGKPGKEFTVDFSGETYTGTGERKRKK